MSRFPNPCSVDCTLINKIKTDSSHNNIPEIRIKTISVSSGVNPKCFIPDKDLAQNKSDAASNRCAYKRINLTRATLSNENISLSVEASNLFLRSNPVRLCSRLSQIDFLICNRIGNSIDCT